MLVLSDCAISGNVLGKMALGAMNLLMPIFSTVSFFTWLLAVGTSIVYSEAMGRTENLYARKLAGQGLLTAVIMGIVLSIAIHYLRAPYLCFMSPDAATIDFANQYWRWYPIIVILEAIDMVLLYLVYTDGGERACLVSYLGQVVVNVVTSYYLCAHTSLQMSSVSLGTVFAYLVGIAALLPHLYSSKCGLRFSPAFMPRELFRSLKASFGDASAGLFHALLFFVITKYMLSRWNAEMLPIIAVVFCIVRLTVFFNGVGIALQPLETVYYGERNEKGISMLVNFAMTVSILEGALISAIIFAFPNLIISLVGIVDEELIVATKHAARITVIGLTGYALTYMLNSHFQYVGKPSRSILLTSCAFFVVPVGLVLLLGAIIGANGVWVSVAIGPIIALLLLLPILRSKKSNSSRMHMFTFKLWKQDNVAHILGAIERAFSDVDLTEEQRDSVLTVILKAVERIGAENGERKVLVELTIDLRDGIRIILRDDGKLIPLPKFEQIETIHMPVTGYNRNILIWHNI